VKADLCASIRYVTDVRRVLTRDAEQFGSSMPRGTLEDHLPRPCHPSPYTPSGNDCWFSSSPRFADQHCFATPSLQRARHTTYKPISLPTFSPDHTFPSRATAHDYSNTRKHGAETGYSGVCENTADSRVRFHPDLLFLTRTM
jgi:hypothetical protein